MLKRLIDVCAASLLLLVTAPVQLAVALLVAIDLGRPVLFYQLRMGRDGRPFRISKFRSMRHQPGAGPPLTDEQRVTPLGRAIRRFRLDELPQTLAILAGSMSLVGPRPLYPDGFAPANARLFELRHVVRPGMTGWAQVNGNTLLSEREKLALDAEYVARASLVFDGWILWLTLVTLAKGERRNEANISKALMHADRIDRNG